MQQWERAASEYEKLAEAWPEDRSSVLALISAGRIYLRQLERRDQALRLYIAAQNSPVPHQDWNDTIRKGVEAAMGKSKTGAAKPARRRQLFVLKGSSAGGL